MPPLPKPPRAIRLLAQFGGDALRPTLVNGRYQGPMVKPRVAAMVRKRAHIEGTVGNFCPQFGGWLEEWDVQRKVFLPRTPKGHGRERDRKLRADKITRAMEQMPKKLKDHKEEVVGRRPTRGMLWRFTNVEEYDVDDGVVIDPFIAMKRAAQAKKAKAAAKGGKKKK